MAPEPAGSPQRRPRRPAWARRTIRALIAAQALILLTTLLYLGGVALHFGRFGAGGDPRGGLLLLLALVLAPLALVASLIALLCGALAWRNGASPWWPALAFLLPLLEAGLLGRLFAAL